MEKCEHDINLIEEGETWITSSSVEAVAVCSICGTKFKGLMFEYD